MTDMLYLKFVASFQFAFKTFEKEKLKNFGGSMLRGNARDRRPISLKRPLHLVMRSSHARGERSFLRRSQKIQQIIERTARAKGVKVYRFANSGNHLHLIVLPRSRVAYNGFIRTISGLIARLTLGAERGQAAGLKFWDARPFTRILEWGKDFKSASDYLIQNTLEALGFTPYKKRSFITRHRKPQTRRRRNP